MSAAGALPPPAPPPPLAAHRLARLLVRARFRHGWNALRARPSGPAGLVLMLAVGSALAYVVLLATALGELGNPATGGGPAAQAAALTLVAGAIAAASLAAKAAAGEAVLAGTPENEFFLARPLALRTLVLARCLAGPFLDPFGSLFLLPALLAAALVWALPAPAFLVAVVTSVAAQIGIAALAQAVQIAVARWVPRRHRPSAWMALRLGSVLAVAAVWVSATWVLRAPAWLAPRLPDIASALALTPAAALSAPLAAYRASGPVAALAALAPVVLLAAAAVALSGAVARRAGMRGWEEAGAPFTDAGTMAPVGPPLGPVRREWRLLARDRPRLLALVAMPLIFIGVQLVGSVGWSWATATVDRVAALAFSFTLYLATLGPLAHMQSERRAFWIAHTVPVSMGTLMAAKVKAWVPIIGGTAAVVFVALSLGVPGARPADLALAGALVVLGAVTVTAVAIALAASAADLSDPERGAIGPGAVYLFLLLGGLYNLVLRERGARALAPLALYLAAAVAYWRSGVAHVVECFDAEALARRPLRVGDAATLLLLGALLPRAAAAGAAEAGGEGGGAWIASAVATTIVGVAAGVYLARRQRVGAGARAGRGRARAIAVGVATGLGGAAALRLWPAAEAAPRFEGAPAALLFAAAIAEELILRGAVAGAIEVELAGRPHRRIVAAALTVVAALLMAPPASAAAAIALLAPTVAWTVAGGSLAAAVVARAVIVFAAAFVW